VIARPRSSPGGLVPFETLIPPTQSRHRTGVGKPTGSACSFSLFVTAVLVIAGSVFCISTTSGSNRVVTFFPDELIHCNQGKRIVGENVRPPTE